MLHKDTKEDYLTNPINQGWLMKEGTKLYICISVYHLV